MVMPPEIKGNGEKNDYRVYSVFNIEQYQTLTNTIGTQDILAGNL